MAGRLGGPVLHRAPAPHYLSGDESPGRWWGRGTGRLGLQGVVDPDGFLEVMAGHDPATGQDLGRRFGEVSVGGYDATFSAPKSVSVLFGIGDEEVRSQAVDAPSAATGVDVAPAGAE